ncbi:MAG: hypothetical protein IRY94_06910 [Rhodospirillaceae bacterium]|nr:hypothetical protein [Rhodospirillaceae bacterium]
MRLAGALAVSLAAAAALGGPPAQAYDARSLLALCRSAVFAQECLGYLEGVTDMLHLAPSFARAICPPRQGLPLREIIDLFERFAERYPQLLSLAGSEVIGMSLAQAHPCPEDRP